MWEWKNARVFGEHERADSLDYDPSSVTFHKLISFPDLSLLLHKSRREHVSELTVRRKCLGVPSTKLVQGTLTSFFSPQVPQRTSSIATALNTSGAGGSRPAQAVRAR